MASLRGNEVLLKHATPEHNFLANLALSVKRWLPNGELALFMATNNSGDTAMALAKVESDITTVRFRGWTREPADPLEDFPSPLQNPALLVCDARTLKRLQESGHSFPTSPAQGELKEEGVLNLGGELPIRVFVSERFKWLPVGTPRLQ